MAEWSGSAKVAWRQLCESVDDYRGSKPQVIKIDLQEGEPIYDLPELAGKIHGWGEAMVVKRGEIVFFTALGKEKAEIQSRCEELLRIYEA